MLHRSALTSQPLPRMKNVANTFLVRIFHASQHEQVKKVLAHGQRSPVNRTSLTFFDRSQQQHRPVEMRIRLTNKARMEMNTRIQFLLMKTTVKISRYPDLQHRRKERKVKEETQNVKRNELLM